MTAYYNDNDPFCAQWLRNLIAAGHIALGIVDERDIRDVRPDELAGYDQCHFFAGIGGWSYALRLAGWPDDRPVWSGSCPCQPFSVAGFQKGFDDDRHLWPIWRELIRERNPAIVFGEQVAGASEWLRLVRSDLEEMGYAVGAMPIQAASADADHFRDRYWFVADHDQQRSGARLQRGGQLRRAGSDTQDNFGVVADGDRTRSAQREAISFRIIETPAGQARRGIASCGDASGEYIECPDEKWRRLPPPRVRWLGNGIPARVAKLRAFGNAIDPRVAKEVIEAYLDAA